MYIERLRLENVRTFAGGKFSDIAFVHPDADFRSRGRPAAKGDTRLPRPLLPNVNLLLGDNGSGKSSVLRAIAACAFGPAAKDLLRDGTIVRFGEARGRRSRDRAPRPGLDRGPGPRGPRHPIGPGPRTPRRAA